MCLERRGWIIWHYRLVNQRWEELGGKAKLLEFVWRLNDKSRMRGDCPVRICEGLGVKFPRATRLIKDWDILFISELLKKCGNRKF
jgi:hypothetical protein